MTTLRHYIIEDGKVRAGTFTEWVAMMECCHRHVGDTKVGNRVRISTVFLGLDHSWSMDENAPPILFETLAFVADRYKELQRALSERTDRRYATLKQAQRGHALAVEIAREHLPRAAVKEADCGVLGETIAGAETRRAQIENNPILKKFPY